MVRVRGPDSQRSTEKDWSPIVALTPSGRFRVQGRLAPQNIPPPAPTAEPTQLHLDPTSPPSVSRLGKRLVDPLPPHCPPLGQPLDSLSRMGSPEASFTESCVQEQGPGPGSCLTTGRFGFQGRGSSFGLALQPGSSSEGTNLEPGPVRWAEDRTRPILASQARGQRRG